jgi:hypothetical protein
LNSKAFFGDLLSLSRFTLHKFLLQLVGKKWDGLASLDCILALLHENLSLNCFLIRDKFVFQRNSVQSSETFAFIDNGEDTSHGKFYFAEIVVAVKNLLQLLAHQEIRLKLILFFQTNVPKFVQIAVVFKTEFLGLPRAACGQLLSIVLGVACPLVHLL